MASSWTICAVRAFTRDLERALAFYRDVLDLAVESSDTTAGFAVLDTGSAKLVLEELNATDPESSTLVGRFVGVSFGVRDLGRVHAELTERGVRFDGAPERQPWGGVLAHFRDPDDNVLTLVQPPALGL